MQNVIGGKTMVILKLAFSNTYIANDGRFTPDIAQAQRFSSSEIALRKAAFMRAQMEVIPAPEDDKKEGS
jgi:hypothetical protein